MAEVPGLQDRGRRKRDKSGQVDFVLDESHSGLIKRVAVGKKPIATVFTCKQEDFIVVMAGRRIEFSSLAVLGSLMAQRWRFEDPASRSSRPQDRSRRQAASAFWLGAIAKRQMEAACTALDRELPWPCCDVTVAWLDPCSARS